jgi:hypothetical protein
VVDRNAVKTDAGTYAWLIEEGEDGTLTARRRDLTLGLTDAKLAEVLTGLQPGDRVITSGSPAIIDGTVISVPESS